MKRDVKMQIIPRTELSIEDMLLKTDKAQKVSKVVFQSDIGDISWRANIDVGYQEVDGFKVEKKVRNKPGLDELPEIVYNIRDQLKDGSVTIASAYREWHYGDKTSYTFNDSQISDMEIVSTAKKTKKKK